MKINQLKKVYRLVFLSLIISTWWISFVKINQSIAQSSTGIRWSNEEIVAQVLETAPQSLFPVIAADNYGIVHVFWTIGEGIYYSYKKDNEWSHPIDIVWGDNMQFTFPAVIIDHDSVMHLFWVSWGEIRHKYAPSQDAGNFHSWSNEQVITGFGGTDTPIRAAIDSQNRIHVVFSDWYGKYGQTVKGNVYHVISEDKDSTWSDPVKVSTVAREELATDPRIAIDNQDRVHIVWGQMAPLLNGQQQGVYYSRLSYEGAIEINQKEIDYYENNQKWLTNINIALLDFNQVIVTWVCGMEQAQRCSTWSPSGGNYWREPQKIFGELLGLSGWDALIVDAGSNLYWIGVLRYPQALYMSKWDGNGWQDPPEIASTGPIMQLGENINTAINLGNQIHVVVQLGNNVAYMRGITNSFGKPTPISSTFTQEIINDNGSESPTQLITAITTPQKTDVPSIHNFSVENNNSDRQLFVIVIGIASPLILLVVFGFIRLFRRQ